MTANSYEKPLWKAALGMTANSGKKYLGVQMAPAWWPVHGPSDVNSNNKIIGQIINDIVCEDKEVDSIKKEVFSSV